MKLTKCDQCGNVEGADYIHLEGISSLRGGILMPSPRMKFDFCSQRCFWTWCAQNGPNSGGELVIGQEAHKRLVPVENAATKGFYEK